MDIIRAMVSNSKIRSIIAAIACIASAAAIHAVSIFAFSGKVTITDAFGSTDNIRLTGCLVESTACLNYDGQYFSSHGGELLKELGTVTYRDTPVPCYETGFKSEQYEAHATVSWSEDMNRAYLHIKADLNGEEDMSGIYDRIDGIINDAKRTGVVTDSIIYTQAEAVRSGKMTAKEQRKFATEAFERLGAKEINGTGNNNMTVYGYAPLITGYIKSAGEKINVQIAYTYNELKDVTEIRIATPIINTPY